MTSTMAFAISTPTSSFSNYSSAVGKTSSLCYFSNSTISIPKNAIFKHINCISQLGFTPFSQWNRLKYMGISISQHSVKMERKGKCKRKGVYASLFGIGAPEVLVIGVVALLVFGPKGLAEVARNLGKTLRAFQPTIRELQEVSREFKSTLEREIGLDDIDNPAPKSSDTTKLTSADSETTTEPNGSLSENGDQVDELLMARADQFRGTLAQLQKEQEEDRQREEKEREEREKAQTQTESETPSQDTSQEPSSITKAQTQTESETPAQDTPQALDTPQEPSSFTTLSENPDNGALQEAAAVVVPTSPAPMTEIQT